MVTYMHKGNKYIIVCKQIIITSPPFTLKPEISSILFIIVCLLLYRSRDYDKAKQDGGVRKTKCVSSNNCTHANIKHTVTF